MADGLHRHGNRQSDGDIVSRITLRDNGEFDIRNLPAGTYSVQLAGALHSSGMNHANDATIFTVAVGVRKRLTLQLG